MQIVSAESRLSPLPEKDKGKCMIDVESVEKLSFPIPLEVTDRIQGMMYTSYEKLLTAKNTRELRIDRKALPRIRR